MGPPAAPQVQFLLMLNKGFDIHEANSRLDLKGKARALEELWLGCRRITQAWDLTIGVCAKRDLDSTDFADVERAILLKETLDSELLAALDRKPVLFHLGLLPSLARGQADEEQAALKQTVLQAQRQKLKADFELFKLELSADQAVLKDLMGANTRLQDFLKWKDNLHRHDQLATGQKLAKQHMAKFFPLCTIHGWDDFCTQCNLVLRASGPLQPGGTRHIVFWLDLATPYSRDALKLEALLKACRAVAQAPLHLAPRALPCNARSLGACVRNASCQEAFVARRLHCCCLVFVRKGGSCREFFSHRSLIRLPGPVASTGWGV